MNKNLINKDRLKKLAEIICPSFTNLKLEEETYLGNNYTIIKRKNDYNERNSFVVFFPHLEFPDFIKDPNFFLKEEKDITPEQENSYWNEDNLNHLEEGILESILYQSPFFKNKENSKRCFLSDEDGKREYPFMEQIPKGTRILFFEETTKKNAKKGAESAIEIFKEYEKPLKNLLESLQNDSKFREEFSKLDKYFKQFEFQEALNQFGFNVDILPYIIKDEKLFHQGVPYSICELSGGELYGEDKHQFRGFIPSIKIKVFDPKDLKSIEDPIQKENFEYEKKMERQDSFNSIFKESKYFCMQTRGGQMGYIAPPNLC